MTVNNYCAWKHKSSNKILQSEFPKTDFNGGLYKTEMEAFEDFRSLIGESHICESLQDDYVLVQVTVTQEEPMSFSDCLNCPWGIMKLDRDNIYECDNCGYREYHN